MFNKRQWFDKNHRARNLLVSVIMLLGVQLSFGLSVTSYTTDVDGITCICNTGVMKVKICKDAIVRVAYSPTSTIPNRSLKIVTNTWTPQTSFTKTEAGNTIILQTSRIKVKVDKTTANVTYTDLADAVILSEYSKTLTPATVEGVSTYKVDGEWNSPTDEGLYGLGQHQQNKVNLKGFTEGLDQNYAEGTAIDVVVSTRGYGIFWDNYSYTDFRANIAGNTRFSFNSNCSDIAGGILDYYFFYGPEIDQVIAGYRTATGHAPLFPKWGYGLIQSRDRYASQAELYGVMDGYRNNKIPVDCIVQDWHYWDGAPNGKQGCFCFWSGYGDYKTTIKTLHGANIHTMLSIWAQLEEGSAPYATFKNNNWLWPTTQSNCNPMTLFIDSYNKDAREAFWKLLKDNAFDTAKLGFDAWWLDNDEPWPHPCGLDRSGVLTAMGKGAFFYNTYTFPMSEMGYNNWRRDFPDKRFVMLHRANFAGQQAHSTMQWSNDILSNFDVLTKQVPCGLNSTISGIPYWCSDIGGYWGPGYVGVDFSLALNQELMTRWTQYGAFCPVFRIHGKVQVGQGKELYASNFSATTRANLILADNLRYRLMPYIYSLAWKTTNEGYTPMRHLIFDFRTDPNVKAIGTQFMYGPAFMVSPVTAQGQTSRNVYLPAGKWYDFWTGASVNGGATINNVDAPLSHIPLHIRAGSIVPMGPRIQYANERADTIELRVYPGANGSFTIYEDEGDNYNYEKGGYATIPITYTDGDASTRRVTIGARVGSYTGMPTGKVFNIVYVGAGKGVGEGITANPDCVLNYTGAAISGCPGSGVVPLQQTSNAVPSRFMFRTTRGKVMLGNEYIGLKKSITVYDVKGQLVNRISTKDNFVDLGKGKGQVNTVRIVKVKIVP